MMLRGSLIAVVFAVNVQAVVAEGIGKSLRPVARGTVAEPAPMRPRLRPDGALQTSVSTTSPIIAGRDAATVSDSAVTQSLRPHVRTAAIVQQGQAAAAARRRGQVCGDPAIQGEAVGRVEGRGACGIDDAVRIRSVAGVSLSTRALMDCRTAEALKTWVERGAKPAVGQEGGGIASLRVVAHYACRNRNNQAGGKLSEHAKGHAIDIAGIGLRDGSEMTVLTDWNTRADGAQLRAMHSAACGPFGTVLGPEANRFHRDHFHFDTARYRGGSYCR